jgi:hypothetical protein
VYCRSTQYLCIKPTTYWFRTRPLPLSHLIPGNNKDHNNNNGEEHVLFAGGKFKGKSHHCGQYEHQTNACWTKDPSRKPSGSGGRGGGQQHQPCGPGQDRNTQGGRRGQNGCGGGHLLEPVIIVTRLAIVSQISIRRKEMTAATATGGHNKNKNNNNGNNGNNNNSGNN